MIAICVPSYAGMSRGFAMDLLQVVAQCGDVAVFIMSDSCLPALRAELVKKALAEQKVTHILWLDSDMRFPAETAQRLLDHHVPIVGANYSERKRPIPTASRDHIKQSSVGRKGLEPMHVLGLGVCLTAREIFETIPKPWFLTPYLPAEDMYMTDDVYLFAKAREAGYTVWVDHDLSQEVKHQGLIEREVV